ncbi:hypothetical protein [Amycolatopsis palatopharyngis]|uniref:hypothetical protein n=1 Tax=Amycolatopsis palatopharyngis TaxID=187982 RepID=UPI000E26BACC|nr:hypothetical protein [Amycolatopsis palatopharyngis]
MAVQRVTSFVAAAGMVLAVLLGSVPQAAASPADQQRERAAVQQSGETQAFVVGGLAFVLMVGAAGAVLWFTAKGRNHSSHGHN